MSQQEMNYKEPHNASSESNYAGYDGIPSNDLQQQQPSFNGVYGQKLSEPVSRMPSPGQRLALAIVSLGLLVITTFILTATGASYNGSSPSLVLMLFYVTVIIINVIFNRKH